jgi:peptidyl-prolyl cis-trans isomerase SurA
MMFRAAARVGIPLGLAAVLCFPSLAQNTEPSAPAAQNNGQSSAQASPTLGSSTSLNNPESNDLASLYGTPVEQIIARVNDRVITNSDLKRAQSQLAEESRQGNWSSDQYDKSKKTLLRDLIDQQLLLSKGKQLGVTGDTELIKRLDKIRNENHLASMDDLEKAVERQGISYEDFKQNIRNSIITQLVVQQEVGSKMQISQVDVKKYYEDHLDKFTHPESIDLSEILIPTEDDATAEQLAAAEKKADDVYTKLKAGGNFADLAKEYSGGPNASQGGQLGNFKRGQLAEVLEKQTFDLEPGEYTKPIRTRQGYIILDVTAHQKGGTSPLDKVEQQIQEAIYMQRIQPAVRKYLTQLRTEAYIDIRPGYTDVGASPNESKPTYTAYVPPQPKKNEKKPKLRYERERYGHLAERAKKGTASSSEVQQASESNPPRPRRIKPEKLRYGRPPLNPVSAQQVPLESSSSSTEAASASAATEAPSTEAAPTEYVQPLGPDLLHAPKINTPKESKWRFSHLARNPQEEKRKNKEEAAARHQRKAEEKAEKTPPKPTALTPAEAANQKVQQQPLGLGSEGASKKKQKNVEAKSGEKTRFSDQAKDKGKNDSGSQTPSSESSSSPQ